MTDPHSQSAKMCLFDSCWCSHQPAERSVNKQADDDGDSGDGSGHCEPDHGWIAWQQEAWLEKEAAWQAYEFDRLQRAQMDKDAQAAASAKTKQSVMESETIPSELSQPKQFNHLKNAGLQDTRHASNEPQVTQSDAFLIAAAWEMAQNATRRTNLSFSTIQHTTAGISENEQSADSHVTDDDFWVDVETDTTSAITKSAAKELPSSNKTAWLAASAFVTTVSAMEQQVGPVIKLAQILAHYLNVAVEQNSSPPSSQSLWSNH